MTKIDKARALSRQETEPARRQILNIVEAQHRLAAEAQYQIAEMQRVVAETADFARMIAGAAKKQTTWLID